MSKTPRPLGYAELAELDVDALIKEYNRVADRINRRISRAGGVAKTGAKRLPVIRSRAAIARFRALPKTEQLVKVKMAEERASRPTFKAAVDQFRFSIKRTIRQSFMGHHLFGDYYGDWVNDLPDDELLSLWYEMEDIREADKNTPGENNGFWYLYRRAHIIGAEVEPITDYQSFRRALETTKRVMAYESTDLLQMTPTDRLRVISERTAFGGF